MYQDHMGPWDHFWSHWFQLWGKQATLEIYSPLEKVIVIRVVQQQAWWLLSETFHKILKRLKVGLLGTNFKELYMSKIGG